MAQSRFTEAVQNIVRSDKDANEDLSEFFTENDIDATEFASLASTIAKATINEMIQCAHKEDADAAVVVLGQSIGITLMLGFRAAEELQDE